MRWIEVCVEADSRGIDALCNCLDDIGITGLVIEDEQDIRDFISAERRFWDELDADFVASRRGVSRVKFYLSDDEDGRAALARCRMALAAEAYPEPYTALVQDEDWENNWKQYYKPFSLGEKLWIVPEWETAEAPEGRIPLRMNPGLIFGTGSHPSTRMCLEAAEQLANDCDCVLDLGCGSGILAIASLLLGAKSAVGCDIDSKAPEIARENAAMNGVAERLTVSVGDVLSDTQLRALIAERRYPLIFLNIVADVILSLCADAAKWLAPDGVLLCSGIIDGRETEIQEALERVGLTILSHRQTDNWHFFAAKGGSRNG